jgi:hypothetical protein
MLTHVIIKHLSINISMQLHDVITLGDTIIINIKSYSMYHHLLGLHPVTRISQEVTHPKTPLAQAHLIVQFYPQSSSISLLPHLQNLKVFFSYELFS